MALRAKAQGPTRHSIPDGSSNTELNAVSEPPDGGVGWLQVLISHLELFNTFGYMNSYGIFEQYYNAELGYSLSSVSWIGSVQVFLLFLLSTVSGRLFDAGYFRHLLIIGSFLQVFGVFMASLSTQYWHLLLSQGVCSGIGAGLVYCPVMACVATYFSKKRALAIATVTSGSATGGVVFPIIARQMLPVAGFPWTIRCMGFVILFNAIMVILLAKPCLPPRRSGSWIELAAFKELSYSLFAVAIFLVVWSVYIGYSYINHYGTSVLKTDSGTSLAVLLILNALGCPGRIIPALVADVYLGPFWTLIPLVASAAVLYFGWIGVKSLSSLIVFSVFFGLVCGGVQGMAMTGLPSLTADLNKMGTRMGMVLTIVSIAALTGPPLAGKLIEAGDGDYIYMEIWGGCAMSVGALFIYWAQLAKPKP